jgi:hypothetical protein
VTVPYRPGARTPSWLTLPTVLLVGAGGTLLALWSLGWIGSSSGPPVYRSGPPPAGFVAVPKSFRKIPAFSQVMAEDILDPRTMEVAVFHVPEEEAKHRGVLIKLEDIVGRVTSHDKPAGYAFSESDFFPKNTRPGPSGGIPPGKRGMRLEASKVRGIHGFRAGDLFDIVATSLVNMTPLSPAIIVGSRATPPAPLGQANKAASVHVVVQNGIIIAPVTVREEPVGPGTSLIGDSHAPKTKPVEEVLIAVDPSEVAPLAEALATGAELQCVPRSGWPDDPKDLKTPGLEPASAKDAGATIETIGGNSRDVKRVPKAGS